MSYILRNKETVLFALSVIAVLCASYLIETDIKIFIGLLAGLITLYLGIIRIKIENDKLFKELFQEFNSRYDARMNDLINGLTTNKEKKLNIEERNTVIDYFNLCSEEYLWYKRGRIPGDVWKAWRSGIIENLRIKQVRGVYEEQTKTKDGQRSFYGLYEELKDDLIL